MIELTHSPIIAEVARGIDAERVRDIELAKASDGSAEIRDQGVLDRPAWP